MFDIVSTQLRNYIIYDHAELNFDPGIICIQGENIQSKSNNAVGKSLLTSSIPVALFSSIPTGDNKIKNSFGKDTCIEVTVELGKTLLTIQRGKSLVLLENGRDITPNRQADAQELLYEKLPLNEEIFYTTMYLDSRRTTAFQYATAAARSAFFTQLFDFSEYDRIRGLVNDEIRQLSHVNDRHAVLLEEMEQHIPHMLTPEQLYALETEYTQLSDRATLLADRQAKIHKLNCLREEFTRYHTLIKEKEALLAQLGIPEEKIPENIPDQVRRGRNAIHAYAQYKNKMRCELKIKALNLDIQHIKIAYNYLWAFNEVDNWPKNIPENLPEKIEELQQHISAVRFSLDQLTAHLEGHQHGDACFVCGSTFSPEQAKTRLASLRKLLADLTQQLTPLMQYKKYYEFFDLLGGVSHAKKIAQHIDLVTGYHKYSGVSPVEAPKWSDTVLDQLTRLHQVQTELRQLSPPDPKTQAILAKNIEFNPEYANELQALHKKLPALKTKIMQTKHTAARIEILQEDIARNEKILKKMPFLKILHAVHSTHGIKNMAMARMSEGMVENLNQYSYLVYPDPVSFDIDIGKNKFDILARRHVGKRKQPLVSDIKYLSGAESRAFSLLSLLAFSPLLPDAVKSNVIFLDEVTVNMDDARKAMIVEQFLPELIKFVPCVVYVTTDAQSPPEATKTLKVVRSGDKATLESIEHGYE